jgi:GAF domain-containing protein
MNTRETNPKRYENTETAAIYREESPRGRIIEDTESHDDYAELYPGQKARIKSSIIWPVLSANNVLVGTLVMHCDRAQFFKKSEAKFWREVCEVFAKRLAQEKLRLDKAVLLREDGSITAIGANNWPEPPF